MRTKGVRKSVKKKRVFTEEHKKRIGAKTKQFWNSFRVSGIRLKTFKKEVGTIRVSIWCDIRKKRILRYRYVMEQKLGRFLEVHEIVHHINGVTNDDRIENLVLTNSTGHMKKYHSKGQLNSFYGKKHTDEMKKYLSEKAMGRSSPMKGKTMSEEARKKISDKAKGRVVSEETKQKIAKSTKGRIMTEEHKKNLSINKKKYWANKRKAKELTISCYEACS